MNPLRLVRVAAIARIGIGTALALGAGPLLRASLRDETPSGSFILFARTVGIRDALFGLGCLLSTLDADGPEETRRWVRLWLANEVADVVAAAAMAQRLGGAGAATAASLPLPLIAADIWALRHLAGERGQSA
ncbi:MAG: hypothetical protein JWO37_3408 [Acidimicrobiales bacterium]|jgi:hypothetical protein|nr:hypothetical protein [Acidimicrobiales bacterium]